MSNMSQPLFGLTPNFSETFRLGLKKSLKCIRNCHNNVKIHFDGRNSTNHKNKQTTKS